MDESQRKSLLEEAKQLVLSLESGDQSDIDAKLEKIVMSSERALFNEVGQLTRELHDSIRSFALDGELNKLTDKEIPDAKERLAHVIKITDEAANTTLNALDEILPITSVMASRSEKLSGQWIEFIKGSGSGKSLKTFSSDITEFLESSKRNSSLLHEKSKEIMMAQEFQDLTGQIITKVITLVQEVEANLVNLVRLSGTQNKVTEKYDSGSKLEGPAVPGVVVEGTGALNSQDDVDDLLSSLGF
ncbi:MAG: protein phosphatase CheZ [Opitutaceae bacterium]|nr:protein phosphatase CheZ [Opitutaceae bacterium]